MRNFVRYWGPVSASPRSPRYLHSASCCHTPGHVKCPLLHLPSLSRILDLDLDCLLEGPLPISLAFLIHDHFPKAPDTLAGFLSTTFPIVLAV